MKLHKTHLTRELPMPRSILGFLFMISDASSVVHVGAGFRTYPSRFGPLNPYQCQIRLLSNNPNLATALLSLIS